MKRQNLFVLLAIIVSAIFIGASCTRRAVPALNVPRTAEQEYFDFLHARYFDSTQTRLDGARQAAKRHTNEGIYQYLIAEEYALQQEYDSSVVAIKRAITLDSTNTNYWRKYHDFLLQTDGPPSEVLLAAQRVAHLEPTNPINWYTLATDYYSTGQNDSALAICRRYYQQLEPLVAVDILIASIYTRMGQCDSAMQQAHSLIDKNPINSAGNFFTAQTALQCNRDSIAWEYYRKGINSGCPDFIFMLNYMDYLCAVQRGEQALTLFEMTAKQCTLPTKLCEKALSMLLYSLRPEALKREQTRALFEETARKYPNDTPLTIVMYRYYSVTGNKEEISKLVVRLSEADSQNYLWWLLRLRHELEHSQEMQGLNWATRTSTIRRMCILFPFDLEPAFNYVEATLKETNSYQRQLDTLTMIIARYEQQYKRVKSNEVFEYRLQDSSTNILNKKEVYRTNLSTLYGYRGDILVANNEHKKGWKAYEKSLTYNRNNAVVLNNYAYYISLYEPTRIKEALRMAVKATSLEPNNVTYLDTFGYILHLQGDNELARQVFIKILSINANPGKTILLHYSDVLEALGSNNAAELYRLKADSPQNHEK